MSNVTQLADVPPELQELVREYRAGTITYVLAVCLWEGEWTTYAAGSFEEGEEYSLVGYLEAEKLELLSDD